MRLELLHIKQCVSKHRKEVHNGANPPPDSVPKTEKPLSSTLGENPAAKTKGESRIKWPKSVASHGNALIISTTNWVVSRII